MKTPIMPIESQARLLRSITELTIYLEGGSRTAPTLIHPLVFPPAYIETRRLKGINPDDIPGLFPEELKTNKAVIVSFVHHLRSLQLDELVDEDRVNKLAIMLFSGLG